MKEFLRKSIEKFIQYLSHILNKFESDLGSGNNFNTLSPTENAENVENYIDSLDWALKNKNKIKNIAISGAYGSGKSSVIRTFIKRNKNKDYKFLNISLATFKEQKEQSNHQQNGDNDILRLIELSVLQQLFYHEKDRKIPDSRFKKIKSHKTRFLFYYSVGIIALLVSTLFLIAPDFLSKFYLIKIPQNLIPLAHYTAASITIIGLFFIIFKSSRALKSIAIKKLNISTAEIEIDGGISKSILNNHIDEILYFFEVTDYNVVIIEDLDRFEQTEVFTKLREINLLINNSKKIDTEVVFIYAIKDDMFLDKDRTKFFDFMIPIIPVINSSNSNEKLLEIVKKNSYKISTDLIDDISLFIDDMRLLYNIMNEYYIYSKNLDSKLDQEKLLSMVVYKNICPNDFTKLSENKGNLFQTISNKSIYIKERISIINQQIEEIKKRILEAEKSKISDIKELRLIYINKIIEQIITKKNYPFKQFWLNNNAYNISSVTDDDIFSLFLIGNIEYLYDNYSSRQSFIYKFETIEKLVNPDLTYKEREELVVNNAKIDSFKKQISELEKRKIEIRKSELRNLISDELIIISQESTKQSELINILLRNGYIDENYLDYISIFYEGSLTKADYQFLINVKIQKPSEFDYKLTKIERLIEKISLFDFEKEYVLNFELVESLQQKQNDFAKKNRLFIQLSNQSPRSISFIDGFIEITTDIKVFIQNICEYWNEIWTYIETDSFFDDVRKNKYFIYIIKYAKVENIQLIFNSHHELLNKKPDFLQIIDDEKKLKSIIEKLELKFENINTDSPSSLIDFVFKGNHYVLNRDMIEMLLKHYKKFDASIFSTANFTSIMTSSLASMIDYISNNLEQYINSVYLKIETNTDEPLENYLKLLNNESLDEDLKEKLIIKVKTKIIDIKTIKDTNLWYILFEYSKVSPVWENILASFENEDNELSEVLIDYLNIIPNAEELSLIKIPTKVGDKNVFSNLSRSIISENEIGDESYKLITKPIPWWFSDLDFSSISENKTKILINNMKVNPTIESFNKIKESHNGLNIYLLEKFPKEFIEKIDELEFDGDDLILILESSLLSISDKKVLFERLDLEIIDSNSKILLLLSHFIGQNAGFNLKDSTKRKILLSTVIPRDKRIELFVQNIVTIDIDFIKLFMNTLGNEYYEITYQDKKATLTDNTLNRKFLDKLASAQYISSFSESRKGLRVNHKRK
ncbi:MAG: hypothetical protein JNL22_01280 [Bacteroidales bacterium]|nr:hypothetical protein [Bacteroidales bacterium]